MPVSEPFQSTISIFVVVVVAANVFCIASTVEAEVDGELTELIVGGPAELVTVAEAASANPVQPVVAAIVSREVVVAPVVGRPIAVTSETERVNASQTSRTL